MMWSTPMRSSACHQALEQLRRSISLFMRVIFPKTGTHFWVTRPSVLLHIARTSIAAAVLCSAVNYAQALDGEDTARRYQPLPAPRPAVELPDPPPAKHSTGAGKAIIYQSACPALMGGLIVGAVQPPIIEGQCGERSPVAVSAVVGEDGALSVPLTGGPIMACSFSTAIANWALDVALQAQAIIGAKLTAIETGTSYQCRRRNNAADGKISEHGFANALDVSGFRFDNGTQVNVREGWVQEGATAIFLRAAHAAACERFTTVLGPDADQHHSDHFHLDLGCHGKTCTYLLCQ